MGPRKHKKHKSERKDRHDERTHGLERPPGLKLILKVGGNSSTPEHSNDSPGPAGYGGALENDAMLADLTERHKKAKKKKKKKDREKKHKHHHKEKRRKRDDSSQEDMSMSEETLLEPPKPIVLNLQEPTPMEVSDPSCEDAAREPRTCVLRQRQERSPLTRLLEHLLRALEKRDQHQFFAWPVTDNIAPGYSAIITKPMDFSTIKQKIDESSYGSMMEFKEDFRLMCENALRYNHPDTVYYKAAKRLLHVGTRLLQPEKLKALRPLLNYMMDIPPRELGFDLTRTELMKGEESVESTIADSAGEDDLIENHSEPEPEVDEEEKRRLIRAENWPKTKFEAFVDDLTPQEILQQAQTAARTARERIKNKQNASNIGFLRQRKDGSTSLSILVDCGESGPERSVSLGAFSGKLAQGTGQLQAFREDRRNIAKMVKPLEYGAFCSFAPIYDSRFANMSKEESELVLQTYGDETGAQYADSILEFTKNSSYASSLASNLLDLLTGGDHRKTIGIVQEGQRTRADEKDINLALPDKIDLSTVKVDLDSLRSLADMGLDMSFLSPLEDQVKAHEQQLQIQGRLDANAQILERLQQVQNERLSLPLPQHLAQISKPSQSELSLASQVTSNLTDMAKEAAPGDIAPAPAVRKAMGVGVGATGSINSDVAYSSSLSSGSTPPAPLVSQGSTTATSMGKKIEAATEVDNKDILTPPAGVTSVAKPGMKTSQQSVTTQPQQKSQQQQKQHHQPLVQTRVVVPNKPNQIRGQLKGAPAHHPAVIRSTNPNVLIQSQIRSQIITGSQRVVHHPIGTDQNIVGPRQQVHNMQRLSSPVVSQLRQQSTPRMVQARQQIQQSRAGSQQSNAIAQQNRVMNSQNAKSGVLMQGNVQRTVTVNQQNPQIVAQNASINQQNQQIVAQNASINQQNPQIVAQNASINQQSQQIVAQNQNVSINPLNPQIVAQNASINAQNASKAAQMSAQAVRTTQPSQAQAQAQAAATVSTVDIESELREFLESGSAMSTDHDATIEQILME